MQNIDFMKLKLVVGCFHYSTLFCFLLFFINVPTYIVHAVILHSTIYVSQYAHDGMLVNTLCQIILEILSVEQTVSPA